MDFGLTEEQQLVVRTVRDFVERELSPLETQVLASQPALPVRTMSPPTLLVLVLPAMQPRACPVLP